jgi:hypothetical protein
LAGAPRARGRKPSIDDAKRQRVYDRYHEVLRADLTLSRNAAVLLVSKEFGVSTSSVYRFAGLLKGSKAETTREHSHGNACWCRKGPNNSQTNPWCPNKPESSVLPGLRSRVAPTLRNERFTGERVRAHRADGDSD